MNSNIMIRQIIKADNERLAFIIRSVLKEFKANKPGTVYYDATTDNLYALFQTPKSAYLVAEVENKIVGGGGIFPTPGLPDGCCELVKLYLLPEARGKGIGKLLIENSFTAAKQLGYSSMYLETMPELKMAMGLYEHCGFEYLNGSLGHSGHFGCDLWMLKKL